MAYEVIQIDNDTWRIEDENRVRFFLLKGTQKALLIDAGMQVTNAREIAEKLTSLPIELIITHADPDHIRSHGEFEWFYMHTVTNLTRFTRHTERFRFRRSRLTACMRW